MNQIEGVYYYPATSQSINASLVARGDLITISGDSKTIFTTDHSLVSIASAIPGVKLEVKFSDGGLFVAANAGDRLKIGSTYVEKLEKNKALVLASIVLVPLFSWFFIAVLMPAVAHSVVKYLPESVSQQMGEQTFSILKTAFLTPSELSEETQTDINTAWQKTVLALGLSTKKYQLHFFNSEYFGPNAFALPNGIVVITDDLVKLLNKDVNVIEAVLLHEIGHVEHQHSLKLAARSVMNTIVLSVVFGDLDGVGEIMLGTGVTLLENSFSRDMEREADNFALQKLVELNKSPESFAKAMQSFLLLTEKETDISDSGTEKKSTSLLRYLSTHPDTQERIKAAKQFGNQ